MLDDNELMFVLNRYQNILEENVDQSRNWHITRIFRGNLTSLYRDRFNFIDSSEGNYLLFNLILVQHKKNDTGNICIIPAKNFLKVSKEDEVFNLIYNYTENNSCVSDDFKVINPAKFILKFYSSAENKLELALINRGVIEFTLSTQGIFHHSDQQKNLEVLDAHPNNNRYSLPHVNEDIERLKKENEDKNREIEQLIEQLKMARSCRDDSEILQLKEENKRLKEAFGQIVNIAQSLSLDFSVQEEDVATKNFYNGFEKLDNDRQDLSEELPGSEINNYSLSEVNYEEPLDLDLEMKQILDWYKECENNPNFLKQYIQQVSEIDDSFNSRRAKSGTPIVLAPTTNHSFLIFKDYYLFPRPDSKITTPKLNTFEICFECENFQSGAAFEVLKPAIVFKLSERDDRWQLQDRGKLRFLP